jgi:hypothetical protein
MPTIQNEFERLKRLMEKGRGEERCTPIIIPADESKARVENAGPKPKTRFIFETDSPRFYSEFNAAKDRIIRVIENKTVAMECLIKLWTQPTDEQLREMAEGKG